MNTWGLTKEVRDRIKPMVLEHIKTVEETGRYKELELTFQGISPAQLQELMQELGYEETDSESNGWQWDFWINMENNDKDGISQKACISGCGMAFSLILQIGE